jgi:hypothetical protein
VGLPTLSIGPGASSPLSNAPKPLGPAMKSDANPPPAHVTPRRTGEVVVQRGRALSAQPRNPLPAPGRKVSGWPVVPSVVLSVATAC